MYLVDVGDVCCLQAAIVRIRPRRSPFGVVTAAMVMATT